METTWETDPSGSSVPHVSSTGSDLDRGDAEFDSFEEVDAVARSLRRVAFQYIGVAMALFLSIPVLSYLFPWWSLKRIWGGLTPNFLTVAIGLHTVMIAVAMIYNRVANRSEDEMLGRPDHLDEWSDV
jgi:hypothetical protein